MNREELTYRQSTSAVILDKAGRILIVQKNSYKENLELIEKLKNNDKK